MDLMTLVRADHGFVIYEDSPAGLVSRKWAFSTLPEATDWLLDWWQPREGTADQKARCEGGLNIGVNGSLLP